MTNLMINIDHVATLRNARRERQPDPVHAAALCECAGADGIVFHLREDRRHINERDVRLLKETVTSRLDFELSLAPEIVEICLETRPELATIVPERREEVTTEGGLDVAGSGERLGHVITALQNEGIEVSLFVDPQIRQVEAAAQAGADCIELHTGDFANATSASERDACIYQLAESAHLAHDLNLHVHAGHGLDYRNYSYLQAGVPHIREVSIGFAIVARALLVGMRSAVQEMRKIVKGY